VKTKVVNDLPKRAIIAEAERLGADLILVGSHGYGPKQRFLLGSVSHAMALYAPCSVEIVRTRQA
jgi:nucleotide-binding universal stress UspA family protein